MSRFISNKQSVSSIESQSTIMLMDSEDIMVVPSLELSLEDIILREDSFIGVPVAVQRPPDVEFVGSNEYSNQFPNAPSHCTVIEGSGHSLESVNYGIRSYDYFNPEQQQQQQPALLINGAEKSKVGNSNQDISFGLAENEYNVQQYQEGHWLEQQGDMSFLESLLSESQSLSAVDEFLELVDAAGDPTGQGIKDPVDIYQEIHREAEEIQTADPVPNGPSRPNTPFSPFSASFVDSPSLPELGSPVDFQDFQDSSSSSSASFDGYSRDAFTPSNHSISSRSDHVFVRQSPPESQGQKRRSNKKAGGAVHRRQELRERKKEQNREAATRYRLKKRAEKQTTNVELEAVEQRNEDLKKQVQNLEQEIAYLKGLMGEVRSLKMKRSQ